MSQKALNSLERALEIAVQEGNTEKILKLAKAIEELKITLDKIYRNSTVY